MKEKASLELQHFFQLIEVYLSSTFLSQVHNQELFQPTRCLIKGTEPPKVLIFVKRGAEPKCFRQLKNHV